MQSPFIPIDPGSLQFPSKSRGFPPQRGGKESGLLTIQEPLFLSSFWFYLIILWKGLI